MPGAWLTLLARRLLHQDTFDRIVSPAIADLQFEAAHRRLVVIGYVGVFAAFAGALWLDTNRELRLFAGDAAALAHVVAIQAVYHTGLLLFVGGFSAQYGERQWIGVAALLVAISVLSTVVCFWPMRHRRETDRAPGD